MNFNDYFNNQYLCDFNKEKMQEEPFTMERLRTAIGTLSYKKKEQELYDLFEFIRKWRDRYDLFCHNFNCYTYIDSREFTQVSWSTEDLFASNKELYMVEFFDKVLLKRARFELQEHQYNRGGDYDYLDPNFRQGYNYNFQPNVTKIISGNHFILSGQEYKYRLDVKMNSALICSLVVALSNNYIIYDWYSKQSRFKEFIDKISSSHYFVEFQASNQYNRLLISGSQNDPSLRIDIDGRCLYFILPNEILRIENSLHYNHLDSLFGKDREKPLTQEDLQLYSIVNEGRKPLMYDFEL